MYNEQRASIILDKNEKMYLEWMPVIFEREWPVKRKRGKDDRRFFIVHITEKGEEKIKNVLPLQVELITEQMNKLNKNEQLELQKLCKKVGFID